MPYTSNEDAICGMCGKPFKKKQRNQKYCSGKCYKKALYIKQKEEKPFTIICKVCGKEFRTHNAAAHLCSRQCRNQWHRYVCAKSRMKRDKIDSVGTRMHKEFKKRVEALCKSTNIPESIIRGAVADRLYFERSRV